jgi:hypothetical protein
MNMGADLDIRMVIVIVILGIVCFVPFRQAFKDYFDDKKQEWTNNQL